MNRRSFIALASGLLVPEPRRVYSFLWNNPLAPRTAYMDMFQELVEGVGGDPIDTDLREVARWAFRSGYSLRSVTT